MDCCSNLDCNFTPGYPDFDGGSHVTEYEVQMTNSDNTTREVYRGRDTECMVAGLSPGRPYILQVWSIFVLK